MNKKFLMKLSILLGVGIFGAHAAQDAVTYVPKKGMLGKHSDNHKKALEALEKSCKAREGKVQKATSMTSPNHEDYWCDKDTRPIHGR